MIYDQGNLLIVYVCRMWTQISNVYCIFNAQKKDVNLDTRNEEGMTPLLLATRDINFFEKCKFIYFTTISPNVFSMVVRE